MAGHVVPHFHNSAGVPSISVAAREFMCVGALPPYDHPHVFLDMGSDDEIICPYCSTLYKFDGHLHGTESNPPGSLYETPAAA